MPAYLIAEHEILDPVLFEEYRVKVGPLIARFGGTYITRPGSHTVIEADNVVWRPGCVVIIALPDKAALDAWYCSEEFQPLIALRRAACRDVLITLEGA